MMLTKEKQATVSLDEFLTYNDGSENHFYELENGELIAMPSESETNRRIAMFLLAYFLQQGIPFYCLSLKTEVVVNSQKVGVRIPDLVILSETLAQMMVGAERSLITMEMPPPLLAVEIVSGGQEARDYRYKRSEYGARGIAEYWIVDPMAAKVTVLEWVEGFYEEQIYLDSRLIASAIFPEISLTAQQILQAGV